MKRRMLLVLVLVLCFGIVVSKCTFESVGSETPVKVSETSILTEVVDIGDVFPEPITMATPIVESEVIVEPAPEGVKHLYSDIVLTDSEREELAKVLALEAQDQSFDGQCAVVEVVFNRVLTGWSDNVHSVLSAKGQFSTWKYVAYPEKYKPYNTPIKTQYEVIDYVLANGLTVLSKYCEDYGYSNPKNYVYFSTYKVNGKCFIKIQDHYFSK